MRIAAGGIGTLDNNQVAWLDPGIEHGIAFHFEDVRRLFIVDEILIETHRVDEFFLGR